MSARYNYKKHGSPTGSILNLPKNAPKAASAHPPTRSWFSKIFSNGNNTVKRNPNGSINFSKYPSRGGKQRGSKKQRKSRKQRK